MRYFLKLQYLGAHFHGWQRQPSGITVQEVLEDKMSLLLRGEMKLTGAGRTDAGVNARMMIAHFDCAEPLPQDFVRRLNAMVGSDIAIESVWEVAPDTHARFDARSRTYHYYVNHCKSPFFKELSWFCPRQLDYNTMNQAAELLLQVSDFTSFAKLHSDAKTNICHVTHARWRMIREDYWVFEITADRFLRNMVRAVVGTLVEVGRGKMSVEEFARVIERRDRCAAGTSMPAHALYLWDIKY